VLSHRASSTDPPTGRGTRICRLTSKFIATRRGSQIAAVTFPEGWRVNRNQTVHRLLGLFTELRAAGQKSAGKLPARVADKSITRPVSNSICP
jgi:hypothetical protein